MGLQAHPCGNKRPFEELEEPAAGNGGRTQQQHLQQQQNHNQHHYQPLEDGARSAKQQCTIRVGLEAPDVPGASVLSSTPSCNDSSERIPEINSSVTWYRDVQHQQSQTPDYDAYVNGFNAAEARASTPFTSSTSVYYSASSSATNNSESGLVPVPEYSHPLLPTFSGGNGADCPNEAYSSVNIYQNLSSMQPVVLNGESLADRFERVCSSPRPYVQQYSANGRDGVDVGDYNYGSESTKTTDERYWTFGYSSHCPKKPTTSTTSTLGGGGGNYAKCSSYGYDSSGFAGNKSGVVVCQQTENGQKIQRDENGKSYLELGANAVVAAVQPEWRPTWPTSGNNTCYSNQQLHHNAAVSPPNPIKSCSKCGNILTNGGQQQPCYKHQRLSVLSLSMHKLNRYRQCSDPSLHRSVLICNTLRCIEDEMEREGLTGNAVTSTETLPTSTPALNGAVSNCDTCCCSHCGTVLTSSSSSSNNASAPEAPSQAHYTNVNNNMPPNNCESHSPSTYPNFATCNNSTTPVSNISTISTVTMTTTINNNNNISSEMDTSKTSPSNADEDDSGFGDEDSRDIDWSSVFSMSTSGDVIHNDASSSSINSTSAAAHNTPITTTESYSMCDSDPALFTASASALQNESTHWKNSSCNNASWSTSEAGDFSTFRWKSEMGDDLDPGFVTHIMVGS